MLLHHLQFLLLLPHFFIELVRSHTKPIFSPHSSYKGLFKNYKSTFSASNIYYSFYSTFMCLVSSFQYFSNFTFVIALIYRPPTSSLPLFFAKFSVLIETIYAFIICDFNIPHDNTLNLYSLKLDNFRTFLNYTTC